MVAQGLSSAHQKLTRSCNLACTQIIPGHHATLSPFPLCHLISSSKFSRLAPELAKVIWYLQLTGFELKQPKQRQLDMSDSNIVYVSNTDPNHCCLCRFEGDDVPIVRGSALAALQGKNDELGK